MAEFQQKINSLDEYILYKTAKQESLKDYHLAYYYHLQNKSLLATKVLQSAILQAKQYSPLIFSLLGKIYYDNDEAVGYVFYLENEYIWIDYVAVFEKFHSKGYGSKILEALFKKYSNLRGCFFEVEPEDCERLQTIKRMNFYKKLGCEILDFKYYFPNDVKELKMELLYKSFDGKLPDKNEIKKQIEFVFETLHFDVKNKNATLELINLKN